MKSADVPKQINLDLMTKYELIQIWRVDIKKHLMKNGKYLIKRTN